MDYIAAGSNVLLWKKVTWECFFAIIYLRVVRWNKHVYYLYSSVYRLRSTLFLYFQAYKYMLASQTHTHGNSRSLPTCDFFGSQISEACFFQQPWSAALKRCVSPSMSRRQGERWNISCWSLSGCWGTATRTIIIIYYHKRFSPFLYTVFTVEFKND